MAAVVDFRQQHKFANAVPKPVGSVAGACPQIPQHAAEFLLLTPLFASVGSTKSRLRDPRFKKLSSSVLLIIYTRI
jgi:hypothetical protein